MIRKIGDVVNLIHDRSEFIITKIVIWADGSTRAELININTGDLYPLMIRENSVLLVFVRESTNIEKALYL